MSTVPVVDYLSLPPPVRYEELQREVLSKSECQACLTKDDFANIEISTISPAICREVYRWL